MRKSLSFTVLLLVLFMVSPAFGFDVSVDIRGSQDLVALKDGLSKTITARCLSRNIRPEIKANLNVSILQMGDTISFDALLSSNPPAAFHRDMKSTNELSGTVDAMIGEIFKSPASQGESTIQSSLKEAAPKIKFPFVAVSMVLLGDNVFVGSQDTLFSVENGKAEPYWTPPKGTRIYRLYTYQGTILAVTSDGSAFSTYIIKDGKTFKRWDRCIVSEKDSLVASRLYSDKDLPNGAQRWAKAVIIEGESLEIPDGLDILSMAVGNILPDLEGNAIACFDQSNHLTAISGKNTLCTSDTKFSTLPLYLQDKTQVFKYHSKDKSSQSDLQVRYYLMPRILSHGKDIITFSNEEGMSRFIGNLKMYDSARIIACTPDGSDFDERDLGEFKNSYCADIALEKGSVLALIVKKSSSFIQRIALETGL